MPALALRNAGPATGSASNRFAHTRWTAPASSATSTAARYSGGRLRGSASKARTRGCEARVVVDRLFAAEHNNVPFATTRAARLLAELPNFGLEWVGRYL